MKLNLERPIIVFDLETTGTNVLTDRIVELSYIKVYPDGTEERRTRRLNPGIHIPKEASDIHHITDEMVAGEPLFKQVAKSLYEIFEGCDIAGFNSNMFDVPLLIEEFNRANIRFDMTGRRFVDVQNIFHKKEPRTLVAAYRFYCGKNLEEAHSASADTEATYEVLMSQLDRYPDLENDVAKLAEESKLRKSLDLQGKIGINDAGVAIFNFGKYRGKSVVEIFRKEPGYYNWILQGEFPKETKDVVTGLFNKAFSKKD